MQSIIGSRWAVVLCIAHGSPHSYLNLFFDAQLTRMWLAMVEPGASIVVECYVLPVSGATPSLANSAHSYPSHL